MDSGFAVLVALVAIGVVLAFALGTALTRRGGDGGSGAWDGGGHGGGDGGGGGGDGG